MTRRPGGHFVRSVVPVGLCAALATAPLLGVAPARAITPQEAIAAEYVPNPAPALARITIEDVTPRVVGDAGGGGPTAIDTESGIPTVTVTGTIVNVSETSLESVDIRLQRGPRALDADSVRDPLVWSEPSFPLVGEFQRVTDSLAPGESVPYRVTLPAREVPGRPGVDLQLTEPGVYPLLVNVNGTPIGGSPARLDDARTLLPVLDAPGPADEVAPPPVDDDEVPPPLQAEPRPIPLTMLWPLAAPPTRIAHVPGADGPDPVVALTDNSLLHDLSDTGRLTGLVRAADAAFSGPGGQELQEATCVAVDPELLSTVSEMADGRPVVIDTGSGPAAPGELDEPSDPRGDTPGVDAQMVATDAARWLDQLRALTEGACVVALPAAQANLDSVSRIGDSTLTATALGRSEFDQSSIVERILGVKPVPNVLVPASGTLEPGTTAALAGSTPNAVDTPNTPATPDDAGGTDMTALVAAPATRTDTGVVPPPGLVDLAGTPGDRALTYSAALGSALAATGDLPENPRYSDPSTRYWLTADSSAARLQDALAALLAPVIDAANAPSPAPGSTSESPDSASALASSGDPGTSAEQGILAVPPQVWTIDETAAASLLETLGGQLSSGRMRSVPLTDRLTGPVTVPAGSLAEDPTGAADPGESDPFAADPAGPTDERLRLSLAGISTLRSLVDTSDPTSSGADAHLDPLGSDVLRVLSETGRREGGDGITLEGDTGSAARVRTASRLDRLERTVASSLARVDLLPPGTVFTMASPNSPLLLVARNALPFPVQVNIDVAAPPDLHVDPVGRIQIPASGSRTLQVPTQSDSEGGVRHTVTFTLHGPDGRPLSDPVELSVQSGGYPLAQAFALAAAALALVLGGRRFLRYRRGIHDPADEGHRP